LENYVQKLSSKTMKQSQIDVEDIYL
jgi:hypothetical protein